MTWDREILSRSSPRVLRRIVWPVSAIVVVLVTASLVILARERSIDRQLAERASLDLVSLQGSLAEREIESAIATLLHFAEQDLLLGHLSGRVSRSEVEQEYLRYCRISGSLDQIRLIGPDGKERVRVDYRGGAPVAVTEQSLQTKADRYYFQRAWPLERSQVYLSDFDLNVEHGRTEVPWKPVLRVATPVFDESGEKRGILVFNYLGANLLDELARSAAPIAGWTALVNARGYFLEAPVPELSWGFVFGREPTFAQAHPEEWAAFERGTGESFLTAGGMLTTRKIRSGASLGAAVARTDLDLSVVSFVSNEVLYASSWRRFGFLLAGGLVTGLVAIALAVRLALSSALRARHEAELESSEQRLRALSTQLLQAEEDERKRLSRDLHDELGQLATAVKIDLERAQKTDDDGARKASIARAVSGTSRLLESMHRISSRIRSSTLDDLGLEAALLSFCEEFEERTGVVTSVDVDLGEVGIPEAVSNNLYRVVQEALNNVARHTTADRAQVRMWAEDGALCLLVRDEGEGFIPRATTLGRLGLLGMRERVELLGGRFRIDSEPSRGTRVEARVPLTAAPNGLAELRR